ncbi:MAG: translation initiation factor IF-6 [Nitrososphaerota archaeon]|nr:translation initiation factor IF-6 [Nitrososphaerota archaeon]
MGIYLMNMYRSPNIGIFAKTNERFILIPKSLAPTKIQKFSSLLGVKPVKTSIGGSRLIGSLVAMNSYGILVSRFADDEEINTIREETNLPVERVPFKYTSIGNLITANDYGAVVSNIIPRSVRDLVEKVLNVPIKVMSLYNHSQVGSMIAASNSGAIIHPSASRSEISQVASILKVDVEPCTVNGGVPYVSSGILVNSRNAIVGTLTSGPELMILSRVFKL